MAPLLEEKMDILLDATGRCKPLSKVPGLACGLMLPSPDDGSARNGPTLVVSAIRV